MHDWEYVRIGQLCTGLFDGPHATPPESGAGPVFLRIDNIDRSGRIDLSDIRHISEDDFLRWTRRVLPRENDIVFSYEANLGLFCRIPAGFHGCLGRRLALVRPNPSKVDPQYLLYACLAPEFQETLRQHTVPGSTVDRISLREFPNYRLPVPPMAEQKRIAHILGTLDDKIDLNRRMNATLEEMARALFKSWFVDFDPVRAKMDGRPPAGMDAATAALFPNSFQDSPLGPIPEGWEVGHLGDLCTLKRGHDLPTDSRTAGSVPVISSSGFSGTHHEAKVSGPGVVTGRYGTIGKVFFVDTDYWPLNTTLYVEDFRENPPRFIFHVLEQVDYANYTDKAAVPGVNRNHLHEEAVVLPALDARQAFARSVAPLWAQRAHSDHQSRTLAALRDILLPELLSGEVKILQGERHGRPAIRV